VVVVVVVMSACPASEAEFTEVEGEPVGWVEAKAERAFFFFFSSFFFFCSFSTSHWPARR
jgi:hypothetical protein